MLRRLTVLTILALPIGAHAQTITSRTQTTIGSYSYQTLQSDGRSLSATLPISEIDRSDRPCLFRKQTGARECHSHAEWAKVARRLEARRR